VQWTPANQRGCTQNARWVVRLANGDSLFLKAAVDETPRKWLRREHLVYSQLQAPFYAGLRGWHDDEFPVFATGRFKRLPWPPPGLRSTWMQSAKRCINRGHAGFPTRAQSTLPRMEDCVGGKAALPGLEGSRAESLRRS
jgi:hypothetical protein